MKTIGFKDIAGGSINIYFNQKDPKQKRWERFYQALLELEHTGNIILYRINGNKINKLKLKRY